MDIHINRLFRTFSELVAIDSPSFGEKRVCEYIRHELEALGFLIAEDNAGAGHANGCGNLYGYLHGDESLGNPLLFCAHMDTVEPSSGKHAVISEKGRITSRGDTVLGADDISGITAILEALRFIKENGIRHRPIEVLFTVAEEIYCGGAKLFDFTQIKAQQAYVLDLTGAIGSAAYSAPSIVFFTAEITGKAAHAGFEPEKGVHAIAAAADAISKMKLGHVDDDTTLNIGIIHGGIATNIVPDQCTVSGEVRSLSHQKTLDIVETVKRQFTASADAVGASVTFAATTGCKAYATPLDHAVSKRFEKVCKTLGMEAEMMITLGGSDNNYLAENGINGLVIAAGMHQCHTYEEYTTLDELTQGARLVAELMVADDGRQE